MRALLSLLGTLSSVGLLLGCAEQGGLMHAQAVHTASKLDMTPCATNADCRVAVYASIGPTGECNVQVLFDKITVAKSKQPKVVWRIEPADPDGDDYDYQFKLDTSVTPPIYGIQLVGNDPSQDFDDPGYDQGSRKFKWKSKHLRQKSFDYEINVQRSPRHQDRWSDCKVLDPRIVND